MGAAMLRHSSRLCSPLSLTKSYLTKSTTLSSPRRSLFLKSRTRFFSPLSSSSSSSSSRSSFSTKANENDKVGGDSNGSPAPELCLYNTMSRAKEIFEPSVAGRVGMYVCGVTAYDFSHIGHARVYVTFDVLYQQFFLFVSRYLQHLNYDAFYVRNFTDVDDKKAALQRIDSAPKGSSPRAKSFTREARKRGAGSAISTNCLKCFM